MEILNKIKQKTKDKTTKQSKTKSTIYVNTEQNKTKDKT